MTPTPGAIKVKALAERARMAGVIDAFRRLDRVRAWAGPAWRQFGLNPGPDAPAREAWRAAEVACEVIERARRSRDAADLAARRDRMERMRDPGPPRGDIPAWARRRLAGTCRNGNPFSVAKGRISGWGLEECRECGSQHPRWIRCGDPACEDPRCIDAWSRKRATAAARDMVERGIRGGIGIVTLTMPPALRTGLTRERWAAFRRSAAEVLQDWCRWMLGPDALPYILAVGHPEGDSRPGRWAPHLMLLFPLAVPRVEERAVRGWYRLPGEVPAAALETLKRRMRSRCYMGALGYPLGKPVVIHYEFRGVAPARAASGNGEVPPHVQVGHAMRYFLRHWPGHRDITRIERYGAARLPLRAWEGAPPAPEDPYDALRRVAGCEACGAPTDMLWIIAWRATEADPWVVLGRMQL